MIEVVEHNFADNSQRCVAKFPISAHGLIAAWNEMTTRDIEHGVPPNAFEASRFDDWYLSCTLYIFDVEVDPSGLYRDAQPKIDLKSAALILHNHPGVAEWMTKQAAIKKEALEIAESMAPVSAAKTKGGRI
jgi:hypothetical protein